MKVEVLKWSASFIARRARRAMFLRRIGIEPVIYEGREGERMKPSRSWASPQRSRRAGHARNPRADRGAWHTDPEDRLPQPARGKQVGLNPQPIVTGSNAACSARGFREAALAQGVAVEFGKRLMAVEQHAGLSPPPSRFADGSESEGDFLVGCGRHPLGGAARDRACRAGRSSTPS